MKTILTFALLIGSAAFAQEDIETGELSAECAMAYRDYGICYQDTFNALNLKYTYEQLGNLSRDEYYNFYLANQQAMDSVDQKCVEKIPQSCN